MTLLETERLVRKITDILAQTGGAEMAAKLAGDFAEACRAANLRLQQCESMIRAGDRPQAVQLAETAPNLLDWVVRLEFHGADDWRVYCRANALPVAERIDARCVKVLNDCYAQGITTDHPLYAAYRSATLQRNDEEALKVLQSITRLNPADTNAASELARLDAKVLMARVQHLADSLEHVEPALVVAEIEAIEGFGFKHQPEGEMWRKAQAVRCQWLISEAARAREGGRWMDVLARIDFCRRLQTEFKLELPAAVSGPAGVLGTWARVEQEKHQKEREFQALLGQLQQQIQKSEEKDTSSRFVELPEMRDDYESLHKTWRALSDFARPVPEAVTAAFRKRAGLLEAEIARRMAIRWRTIIATGVVILIIGIVLECFITSIVKSRRFSHELQTSMDQRQLRAVDKLLDLAHDKHLGDARVVAAAESFSTAEHARLDDFETAFKQLPDQLAGEPDADRLNAIAGQLAGVQTAFNNLAADLKTENEPRLEAYEKRWQDYLADSGRVINDRLGQWVAAAEQEASGLDYAALLGQTKERLTSLGGWVKKIQDCEAGYGKILQLRSDLVDRAAAVTGKFAAYTRELDKLSDGAYALGKARNLPEFSIGIKTIASSEFTASPVARAAQVVQSLDLDSESVLRTLIAATNPAAWACIQKPAPSGFVPDVAMPAEQQLLRELNSDVTLNASHQWYRLWLDTNGTTVDWITAGTLDTSTGWKSIMAWTVSPGAMSAKFEGHDYGWFDGQFRLSPKEPVYSVELLHPENQAAAWRSSGLPGLWSGTAYTKPLLGVLDSLKNSRGGSPLCRAYLFLRVVELMENQPDAWGLTFSPAVRLHAGRIRFIAGDLHSGDWFAPGRVSACGAKLDQFFDSVRPVSYLKQANGLLTLARAAVRGGLRYAGFADADGRPHYAEPLPAGGVWGFGTDQHLVLLAAKADPNGAFVTPALPLSPLYALDRPAADYLADAGVNPDDASFQGVLPPLFQPHGP